jgi:serine/threonine protein kinase
MLTVPGTILGTFNYMSPEQLMAQPANERSDLFSIGLMIFEVLTGRLPFAGRTYSERLASMLRGPFHSSSAAAV